jgi:hypothetical protein
MQKIDDCEEIRLALTRAGVATRPEKCLQIFRLAVTAQCIYHKGRQPALQNRPWFPSSLSLFRERYLSSRPVEGIFLQAAKQ